MGRGIKKIVCMFLAILIVFQSSIFPATNKLNILALTNTVKGTYAVISNQSTITSTSTYSGSFALNDLLPNSSQTVLENLPRINQTDLSSISPPLSRVDYVRPFNPAIASARPLSIISKSMAISNVAYFVGSTRSFWVYDFTNGLDGEYVQITATLKSKGFRSNVWVNTVDYNMSTYDADKISNEFDNKVYPSITTNFGFPSDVDNDGKVNILCYDIKDGFNVTGSYIAGYFDPADLYSESAVNQNTNNTEIFYIDTYPAMGIGSVKNVRESYDILAHEFQHMVYFNQNVMIEYDLSSENDSSIWLNEAFSEAASQVYSGKISLARIDYYNASSAITNGSSLLKWDSTLENYSLAYLFSQYLKEQCGIGDTIFKEILQNSKNDYRAVEDAIKKYVDPNLTFLKFITAFRAALFLKRPTGLYGFKGNTGFNSIAQKVYYGQNGINLYGGGAIVIPCDPISGLITIPLNKGALITYFILQDPPIITFSSYETNMTNQSIYVTASADVGTLNETSHVFDENGTFEFIATNIIGDKTITKITISNIDKVPPAVSGIIEACVYGSAAISFNEGNATLNGQTILNNKMVNINGDYVFTATDLAGNATTTNFKIIDSPYKISNFMVTGVAPQTKITDFKNLLKLQQGETAGIYFKDGNEISDPNAQVGTGMVLKKFNGNNLVDENTSLIYGDINGDSALNIADFSLIKFNLLSKISLTGVYASAGDFDNNGQIGITDLITMKKFLVGIGNISQVKG